MKKTNKRKIDTMTEIEKPDGKSMDIVGQNIEQLKKLFPDVFLEGKINFNQLQELLGNYIIDDEEHYRFTWHGKRQASRLAQTPSTGTLRPCKEESVDWDTTQNLFIEGDNLEVLKLLQKSYHRQVKMIYIDPPYNTGNDFVYNDSFKDGVKNYLEITGQVDGNGKKVGTNSSAAGRYHTNWLNMMYPRLKLARNLLRDDGVIFISIDDDEQANLKKLCDEIFGEENFVSCLVWEKKKKGTFLSNSITNVKEYVLVYCKQLPHFNGLIGEINSEEETYPCINSSNKRTTITIPAGIVSKYRKVDYFLEKGAVISASTMDLVLHSDLVIKNNLLAEDLIIEGNWRYQPDVMTEYANKKELYVTQDLYLRRIVKEPRHKTLKDLLPRVGNARDASHKKININNLFEDGWGSNEDGEQELRTLLNQKGIMDFPKPRKLIEKLITSMRDNNAIVLDFFAGSGTTAHAVMKLNAEEEGNRRCISVQLPETTDEKSEAFKAGYKNIAEIAKERIRRAAKKIQKENPDYKGDLGFKVLKLDSSNLEYWDGDFDTLEEYLPKAVEYIKPSRSNEDILYELLLKFGLDLTVPIEIRNIAKKQIYIIGLGALVVCLEKKIGMEVVGGIGALKKELQPDIMRVVFKDDGFHDDVVKTNVLQTLERYGIDDVRSL